MISLILPPQENSIIKSLSILKDKLDNCQNIQARANRESVEKCIEKSMKVLKGIDMKDNENGIILYCGLFGSSSEAIAIEINPVEEINEFHCRCGPDPFTQPLEEMLVKKETILYVLADGHGLKMWSEESGSCKRVANIEYEVVRKHNKGGQSSQRFERMAESTKESQVDNTTKTIIDYMNSNSVKLDMFILCGESEVKEQVMDELESSFVANELGCRHIITIERNSSETKELYELKAEIKDLATIINDSNLKREENAMSEFMEYLEEASDLFTCGVDDSLENILEHNAKRVIISESINHELKISQLLDNGLELPESVLFRETINVLELLIELTINKIINIDLVVVQSDDVKSSIFNLGDIVCLLHCPSVNSE